MDKDIDLEKVCENLENINDQIKKISLTLESLQDLQINQAKTLNDISIKLATQTSLFDMHVEQDQVAYQQLHNINERLNEYNYQLQIHIAGVKRLEDANEKLLQIRDNDKSHFDKRLQILEEEFKLRDKMLQKFISYTRIIGGISTIIGFLMWLLALIKK